MFDNLNYIMYTGVENNYQFNKGNLVSHYDTKKIKDIISINTINEAQINIQKLKRKYKLLQYQKEINRPVIESKYNHYKNLDFEEKHLNGVDLKINQQVGSSHFKNNNYNLDASLSIIDCQLGFNMLRSKIHKMKRITEKVLNDKFEYKNKDSALYEFKTRMDNIEMRKNLKRKFLFDYSGYIRKDERNEINKITGNNGKIFEEKYNTINEKENDSKPRKTIGQKIENEIDIQLPSLIENIKIKNTKTSNEEIIPHVEEDDKIDLDLITQQIVEYLDTDADKIHEENNINENNRKSPDKHFSFKYLINQSEENTFGNNDRKINPLSSVNSLKIKTISKHIKKKSLSSMEIKKLMNLNTLENKGIPVEIESTKSSYKINRFNIEDNIFISNDALTDKDDEKQIQEVNISGIDFKEINDSQENIEILKKLALQRLNNLLEETEREEKIEEEKSAINDEKLTIKLGKNVKNAYHKNNFSNEKKINISSHEKKRNSNILNLCRKFKNNPFKFYTENPDEDILKICNINIPSNKYNSNSNSKMNKSKTENSKNITPFEELSVSDRRE